MSKSKDNKINLQKWSVNDGVHYTILVEKKDLDSLIEKNKKVLAIDRKTKHIDVIISKGEKYPPEVEEFMSKHKI